MMHVKNHSHDATSRLTSGQGSRDTSHVTIAPFSQVGLPAKPVGPGHNLPHMVCHHWAFHRLTCAEYEDLRKIAGGRCGICKVLEAETPRGLLVVDHFHGKNGASFIRGMLCDFCNGSVMQCFDGIKAWGANRQWEEAARLYDSNPWEQPSEEALRQLAARTEKLPTSLTRPRPALIQIPLNEGSAAIATKLRRYLSESQVEQLAGCLVEKD
jgi:Recombination endonuclease VII